MSYLNETLHFTDNKIYYTDIDQTYEIMMDWEDEIMSASSAYICQNGGDILEVGFGMGISAGYIQSHSINSHTICENHPQIIPLALEWAKNKPNVTIVTSSWYDVKDTLGTFDGIFYDTFGDDNWKEFGSTLTSLCNKGALATWFNCSPSSSNLSVYPSSSHEAYSVNPEPNFYFNHKTYYLPKWQL